MTDQPALPPPEAHPTGSEPLPKGPKPARTELIPWLYGLGFLALAAAVFYLWQFPTIPAETAASVSDIHAAEQRLDAIDARLGRLEQQPPAVTAADLGKITTRLDTLESRLPDQTQLASRLDALSGRIEALAGRDQSGLDAVKQQLDRDAGRLAALDKGVGGLQSVSDRLNRLVRLHAAETSLAAGKPIGDLPDAPPALSRYAHSAPPTLAQLRLAFPQVDPGAAVPHGQSVTPSGPFIDRVWERAQGLITIRQGDDVVVGDTSASALARARAALDAGDLAGAVGAIASSGPDVQRVAASWLNEAKALVDAQSALADMAAHT